MQHSIVLRMKAMMVLMKIRSYGKIGKVVKNNHGGRTFMITIDKDIKITIDKGDVPVFKNICEMARRCMAGVMPFGDFSEERIQEIRKFLTIIFDGVKL